MTVEIKDTFTAKIKRKEHPNAGKYPGRPTMELGSALTKFLGELSFAEQDELANGTLIVEEEASAEFFDSIKVDDVVGIGLFKGFNEQGENEHEQHCAYKFKVTEVLADKDIIKARNVTFEQLMEKHDPDYRGTEVELAFEDISCALGMGFGEILERDGKPYGVSEDIEFNVKILDHTSGSMESDDDEEEEGTGPGTTGPSLTGDTAEETSSADESDSDQGTPDTGTV